MILESLKNMAPVAFAVAFLFPITPSAQAQDHVIGEDQPAQRVIQLTPQAGNDFVDTVQETASRIKRQNAEVAAPLSGPLVTFEEIDIPKVPDAGPTPLATQENSFKPIEPATGIIKSKDLVVPNNIAEMAPTDLAPLPQSPTKPASITPDTINRKPVAAQAKALTPAIPAAYRPTFATPKPLTRPATGVYAERSSNSSNAQIQTTIESPKFVNVNKPADVAITLTNNSNQPSENVVCVATLPAHTKIAAVSPQPADVQGQTLTFNLDRISAKDRRKIVLQLVPTAAQAINVDTKVRIENIQRVSVAVRQPKLSVVVNGPRQANIGQTVVHEVIVSNLGDGVASNVELNTAFPASLINLKSTLRGTIPSIKPNQSVKVKYESQASQSGPITIKSAAQSDDGMKPKIASLDMQIFEPKLNISAIGPKINFVDRNGIYTIRMENSGKVDINDVNIALAIPMGMKVTTISREANVDASKGILRWKFAKIPAGTTEQIQMMAVVTEAGAQVCQIAVDSAETANKQISLQTMVTTRANVSAQIKNDSGPVPVGGKATFTVEVANRGSKKATDVEVRVELPASLKATALEGQQMAIEGNTVIFNEPTIMPGKKMSYRFAAIGQFSGEHLVRSVTQVNGSERKTVAEDTVFVYEVDEARVSESLTPEVPRRK